VGRFRSAATQAWDSRRGRIVAVICRAAGAPSVPGPPGGMMAEQRATAGLANRGGAMQVRVPNGTEIRPTLAEAGIGTHRGDRARKMAGAGGAYPFGPPSIRGARRPSRGGERRSRTSSGLTCSGRPGRRRSTGSALGRRLFLGSSEGAGTCVFLVMCADRMSRLANRLQLLDGRHPRAAPGWSAAQDGRGDPQPCDPLCVLPSAARRASDHLFHDAP